MGLNINIDELKDESGRYKVQGPRCIIERVLTKVESAHGKKEADKLNELIDNPDIQTAILSQFLFKNGYTVSVSQIRYHRKRARGTGCRCPYVVQ